MTASRKKRIRELQRTIARLEEVIDLGDFEVDLTSELAIKLERSIGPARKQVMFASPPKLLVLHLSRSSFYEGSYGYSAKNNCVVKFPEYLNMDHFTTSSHLTMEPSKPLSRPRETEALRKEDTQISSRADGDDADAQIIQNASLKISTPIFDYALCAIVVHIGSHSSGHYLTFRRRPRAHWKGLSNDWFRISDEDVEPATIQEVMSSNPFLLFYERVEASSGVVSQ